MATARKLPAAFKQQPKFCPGCGHGIVLRLVTECVEELGIERNFIINAGVGCAHLMEDCLDYDIFVGSHGGGGASTTGMKRMLPDTIIMSYQGDGDAYVIGLSQTLNAAYRNENFTVIVINNAVFGMTGGQMGWTTMPGQKTTTSPDGRDTDKTGTPIKVPEIIAQSDNYNTAYVARGTVTTPAHINKTKSYIKKALQYQIDKKGHSLVEILSPCPTNWKCTELESLDRVNNEIVPYYPLGEFKDKGGSK